MSLWTDIAITSGASATSLGLTGTGVYKLISHFLRGAIDAQLDKKLDDKLAPIQKTTAAAVDAIAEVRAEQQSVKLNLATQFGGNGGGIRQAINELGITVAQVQGAFEQHLREGSK